MKLHVLVVDDDDVILMLHKMNIKRGGLSDQPSAFINGKPALQFLDSEMDNDATALILLDINMPVMNGWEFLDELKKRKYKSRIFVSIVTSSVDAADRLKADKYDEVIDFIEKPLNLEKIVKIKTYDQIKGFL